MSWHWGTLKREVRKEGLKLNIIHHFFWHRNSETKNTLSTETLKEKRQGKLVLFQDRKLCFIVQLNLRSFKFGIHINEARFTIYVSRNAEDSAE